MTDPCTCCFLASFGYLGCTFLMIKPCITPWDTRTRWGSCTRTDGGVAGGIWGSWPLRGMPRTNAFSPRNTTRSAALRRISGRLACYRLGAVRAAPGVNRNLAQALGTLLRRRIGGRGSLAHARYQRIHGSDHKEIHRTRDPQERTGPVEEASEGKPGAGN